MKHLGEKVTWCMYQRPPVGFPTYVPSKIEKKVSVAFFLMKMKRGMHTFLGASGMGHISKGIKRKPEDEEENLKSPSMTLS
jgi:hypothetical protein